MARTVLPEGLPVPPMYLMDRKFVVKCKAKLTPQDLAVSPAQRT